MNPVDFSSWSCPLPLVGYPTVVMGHGGGGKLGNELVEHLFLPAFRNAALEDLGDAAERVLAVLKAHPLGRDAAVIGRVTAEHKGMLVARTAMGSNRVIAQQIGEQLPRIC